MSNKTDERDDWYVNDEASDNDFRAFIAKSVNRKPCYSLDEVAKLLNISPFSAYLGKMSALKKLKEAMNKKN